MKSKKTLALCVLALLVLGLPGCGRRDASTLRIAEQFGIAYAPLQIMKEQGLVEARLPGVTVEWKQFGGPTAIREGMVAGEIDFGFMGPAPVLMGIDNGMKWKYATGISFNEMSLMVKDPSVQTLRDLGPEDRIAVLSPACTQHVLLCMAAEAEFGDPNYFDNRLVSMSHPDALTALLSGTEITAHLATPPYIESEREAGMHPILSGEELMGGPFTFITGVATEAFYEERPAWYAAFLDALDEAIGYIETHPEETVKLLAPVYGVTEEALYDQMYGQGTLYSTELVGVEKLSERMQRMGFTKGNPSFDDLAFPNVNREKGD